MFESLFEFLFKYRPLVFERGDFVLGVPISTYLLAVAGVAVAVPTLLLYGRAKGKSRPSDRAVRVPPAGLDRGGRRKRRQAIDPHGVGIAWD